MRTDPVAADLRAQVIAADGWRCVAPRIDPDAGPCADRWGSPAARERPPLNALTVDHVQDKAGFKKGMSIAGARYGRRADSDFDHLVTLCWGHHLNSAWATSHRPELRQYLANRGGTSL